MTPVEGLMTKFPDKSESIEYVITVPKSASVASTWIRLELAVFYINHREKGDTPSDTEKRMRCLVKKNVSDQSIYSS
jgi:hypothetical protein